MADLLREAADLIEAQDGGEFRVQAYRRAASTLVGLPEDVRDVAARGDKALIALPGIGKGIASAIQEILATESWGRLERMRGEADPEAIFRTLPGVGPALARTLHDELHVDTLEALEAAAHDGRLEAVKGVGPKRATLLRLVLDDLLGRRRQRRRPQPPPDERPSVAVILDVDDEYRRLSEVGRLPRIAPKRLNPSGEAWLPVLHTERGPWHFTALFSNTPRAHELGRTRDWVVVYWYDEHHHEGQATVVTEHRGELAGRRVVRGREAECLEVRVEP